MFELIDAVLGNDRPRFGPDDYRLAAAGLLVHVSEIDGEMAAIERGRLTQLLSTHFELSPSDTERLIDAAIDADNEAVDLSRFTDVLVHVLDVRDRERIVALMWQVVLADGRAHEIEEGIVARAARLLHVDLERAIAP